MKFLLLFIPLFLFAVNNEAIKVYEKNFDGNKAVKEIDGFYYILSKEKLFTHRVNQNHLVLKSKLMLLKYLKSKEHKKTLSTISMKGFTSLMVWKKDRYGFMFSRVAIKDVFLKKIVKKNKVRKDTKEAKNQIKQEKIVEIFDINSLNLDENKLEDLYILKEIYFIKGDIDKYNDVSDKIIDLEFMQDI
jgi:hypothetical protein